MKLSSFEAIVGALNEAGVRYLVVGGIAVNAHGYLRVTNDVDIVIRLEQGRSWRHSLPSRPLVPSFGAGYGGGVC
jgi:hypothetical protein